MFLYNQKFAAANLLLPLRFLKRKGFTCSEYHVNESSAESFQGIGQRTKDVNPEKRNPFTKKCPDAFLKYLRKDLRKVFVKVFPWCILSL